MRQTRAETRVGWCPSIVTPMAADDGLLVRVKPTASTLTSDQARILAESCAAHGNGQIDLTNRSNLQIRGLRPETAAPFAEAMRAAGLAADDAAFEEIRNIAADPLGPDDPDAAYESHTLARALEAGLAAEPRARALPPKFGFVVDCGCTLPLTGARGDIFIRTRDGRLTVEPDGGDRALVATPETAIDLCLRLAHAFLDLAGPADRPPYRMRELIAEVGAETVIARAMESAGPGIQDTTLSLVIPEFAPANIRDRGAPAPSMEPGFSDPGSPAAPAAGMTTDGVRNERDHTDDRNAKQAPRRDHLDLMYAPPPADSPIGFLKHIGAYAIGIPGGRLDAKTLAGLADLSDRHADATLRLTPWRSIVLAKVDAADLEALEHALTSLDLITDPRDPRRSRRGPVTLSPPVDPVPAADPELETSSR